MIARYSVWALVPVLSCSACALPPPVSVTIPTPMVLEAIPPSPTPTPTLTLAPTPTQTATVTPTAIPTWEPKLVCDEIIGRLGQLPFPEGTQASGMGADPQGQGNELCWWRVTWGATTAADGSEPEIPLWPETWPVFVQSLGPGEPFPTPISWRSCGYGASVSSQQINRGDIICIHESGSGYPVPPDDLISYRSRHVACRYPSPTPTPTSILTASPTPPPTAPAR